MPGTTNGSSTTTNATSGGANEGSTTAGADETTTGELGTDCSDASECSGGLLCLDGECAGCEDADDGDAACAAAYPELPYCGDGGRCTACLTDSCGSDTPHCDPEVGCLPCTEHDQCPGSACHLGGPDAGSCFDAADVIEVQAPGGFADLLAEVGPGEDRVFVLGAATYTFPVSFDADVYDVDGQREIAILGNGATQLEGSVGANTAFIMSTEDFSQLYLSRVEWNGTPAATPSRIPVLWVGEGAELWVDDTTARGTLFVNGGDAHLRRSNLFDGADTPWGSPGAGLQGGGVLFLENSSIDPGLPDFRFVGQLDVRYSTLLLNGDVICGDSTSGVVRNSIVLTGGDIQEACEGASWSNNAVNTTGFGTSVPAYMQSWFAATQAVRFRLSPQGAEVFGEIAEWSEGDPLLDAQGDPRPTDGPSAAGVDQP